MTKITLIFILFFFSGIPAFGESCKVENLRVGYSGKTDKGRKIYEVRNLEMKFYVTDSNPDMISHLKRSQKDKNYFFALEIDGYDCRDLDLLRGKRSFMMTSISSASPSSPKYVDCVDCVSFNQAPLVFDLPDMEDYNKILGNIMNIKKQDVERFKRELLSLLQNLDPKTSQANSLIVPIYLFRSLAKMGLRELDQEQIEYILSFVEDDIEDYEKDFVKDIVSQMKSINFYKTKEGELLVSLETMSNQIEVTANDIPLETEKYREEVKKYFKDVKISNGTAIKYSARDFNGVTIESVKVNGIEATGHIPIIGQMTFSPREIRIDMDAKAPVETVVNIKKGLSINTSISIDY